MTQFALVYEPSDFAAIAGSVQNIQLPPTLRNDVKGYWDGGLSGWASAPLGTFPGDTSCPLCRILIINNAKGSLAQFRQLLLDIAAALGTDVAQYLITLSRDMGGSDSAREPWPA